mmetsp:Transcript_98532/g.306811  ORF Transcript_98532/g.306811 Transcript_98532/m.306811 type:complete len:491 (+) Transcript_98532:357-1829(+)
MARLASTNSDGSRGCLARRMDYSVAPRGKTALRLCHSPSWWIRGCLASRAAFPHTRIQSPSRRSSALPQPRIRHSGRQPRLRMPSLWSEVHAHVQQSRLLLVEYVLVVVRARHSRQRLEVHNPGLLEIQLVPRDQVEDHHDEALQVQERQVKEVSLLVAEVPLVYGEVESFRVLVHLLVEGAAHREGSDDLCLDLASEQEEPCPHELLSGISQPVLDDVHPAYDDHVEDAENRDRGEDHADAVHGRCLDLLRRLGIVIELLGLCCHKAEEASHHADNDERPDGQKAGCFDDVGILRRILPCRFALEEGPVREDATADPGKRVHRRELEHRSKLQVAGVHRKLDGLDPRPGERLVAGSGARHDRPHPAGGAHGHDAEHRRHRDHQEQPVHSGWWLPGYQIPIRITLCKLFSRKNQEHPDMIHGNDESRDRGKLADNIEVPEPIPQHERLSELLKGCVGQLCFVLRQVVCHLKALQNFALGQTVVIDQQLPY